MYQSLLDRSRLLALHLVLDRLYLVLCLADAEEGLVKGHGTGKHLLGEGATVVKNLASLVKALAAKAASF